MLKKIFLTALIWLVAFFLLVFIPFKYELRKWTILSEISSWVLYRFMDLSGLATLALGVSSLIIVVFWPVLFYQFVDRKIIRSVNNRNQSLSKFFYVMLLLSFLFVFIAVLGLSLLAMQ